MRTPTWLKNEAAGFFKRHQKNLVEKNLLTDETIDSFAQLCEVWRILRNTDPEGDSKQAMKYNSLLKQFRELAKSFQLIPGKYTIKPTTKTGLDTLFSN